MSKKLISWNINGIRAAEKKGLVDFLEKGRYDIVALQEVKAHDISLLSDRLISPDGYQSFFNLATEKKGYSGVAIYTKEKPMVIKTHFGKNELSTEGRVLELEFSKFIFIGAYFPNGGGEDHRLTYKLKFFDEFRKYIKKRGKDKPIIFCGDINVAHNEIDLARPKENQKEIGFLPKEREKLDLFIKEDFVDTFRHLHPAKVQYSWWDQKTRARDRNVGWRIDYFYINKKLLPKLKRAFILGEVMGSDHAPVGIEIDL